VVLYFYWVVYVSVNLAVAIFGMQVRVFTVHILLWKKWGKNNYAYISVLLRYEAVPLGNWFPAFQDGVMMLYSKVEMCKW